MNDKSVRARLALSMTPAPSLAVALGLCGASCPQDCLSLEVVRSLRLSMAALETAAILEDVPVGARYQWGAPPHRIENY